MGDVSKADFNKLLMVVIKAQENAPAWLNGRTKTKINQLHSVVVDLDAESISKNQYDKLLKQGATYLKEVVEANKAGAPKSEEDERWSISGYKDTGDCDKAAKNAIQGVEKAFKKKLAELLEYPINEGHLGCVYEKNILTKGDKYSFFFKFVRKKDYVAELQGIAIGCHSGSNYVIVDKDGNATKTKISAQKKNL